jgi:beta-lactam-binding protein with PASTA domain
VLEQWPLPGREVEPGTAIDLIEAVPPELDLVIVPRLIEQPIGEAHEIAEHAQLWIRNVEELVSEQARDTVLDQNPSAGAEVEAGSPIDVVVAAPRMVEVPDLLNQYLGDAIEILHANELNIGEIAEEESGLTPGIVFKQNPPAGTLVEPQTQVRVVVAVTPPPTEPPPTEPPAAEFLAQAYEGAENIDDFFIRGGCTFTVYFQNLSSNAASYRWDFGDGSTSDEESPYHTYRVEVEGTRRYTVTLFAEGPGGTDIRTQEGLIESLCIG